MSLKNLPERMESSIEMEKSNSRIQIYSGPFTLRNSHIKLNLTGEFYFKWSPSLNTYFEAKPTGNANSLFELFNSDENFSIIIDGLEIGEGVITELNSKIQGKAWNKIVFGDKSIPVKKIKFCIPNLRDFNGEQTIEISQNGKSYSNSRLTFNNQDYKIVIEKRKDFSTHQKELKNKGGYLIQYHGEIQRTNGESISFEQSKDIFHCLSTFLSFLNGRKTSAIFREGFHENKPVWRDFSNYTVDTYKYNPSWPDQFSIKGLSDIWVKFYQLWKSDKDFIRSSIHWYIQSCGFAGYLEGAIIMAQTALELIYNWWIIESKRMILGKDSENLNASNKIRLLISQIDIESSIPKDLKNLNQYLSEEKSLNDGPEVIVHIRNAIVHSQVEKRKKLSKISSEVRYEALKLCIWYIELSLLRILEFKGSYNNRTSNDYNDITPWSESSPAANNE